MKNIILIHGIGGIEKESYFPHLKESCEKLGLTVFMPSLGGYKNNISYETWKKHFDENILQYIDSDTIIIAQSMGTQFAVKYIAENNLKIKAYISCAGPLDILEIIPTAPERAFSFSPTSKLFKPTQNEFNKFKSLNFDKYSFYSDNDIFFSQPNLENYIKAIGSKPILVSNRGHFNFDAEVFDFTELETLIEKISKT